MNAAEWNKGSATAPAFRFIINDKDNTQRLEKRLICLTLTDNRGFEKPGTVKGVPPHPDWSLQSTLWM